MNLERASLSSMLDPTHKMRQGVVVVFLLVVGLGLVLSESLTATAFNNGECSGAPVGVMIAPIGKCLPIGPAYFMFDCAGGPLVKQCADATCSRCNGTFLPATCGSAFGYHVAATCGSDSQLLLATAGRTYATASLYPTNSCADDHLEVGFLSGDCSPGRLNNPNGFDTYTCSPDGAKILINQCADSACSQSCTPFFTPLPTGNCFTLPNAGNVKLGCHIFAHATPPPAPSHPPVPPPSPPKSSQVPEDIDEGDGPSEDNGQLILIIAVALGCAVLAIAGVLVALFIRRRRRSTNVDYLAEMQARSLPDVDAPVALANRDDY